MKKLILATAAAALVSTPAFAQSQTDSADVAVSGTVNQECSIENPTDVTFAKVNINEGAGANALLLKNGSQSDLQNIYVSCNYAAKLSATSAAGALVNAAGATIAANDSADFTNEIDYRVELTATDSSFPALKFWTKLEASDSVTAAGAFHNDASLKIYIDRDDTAKRPVAGTYTDTATITLGAV